MRLTIVFAILALSTMASAQSLPTKVTGIGSSQGNGSFSVLLNTDDPSKRVSKAWLVIETDCAMTSGLRRDVTVYTDRVYDRTGNRTCNILNSWLCLKLTKKGARKMSLTDHGSTVRFLASEYMVMGNLLYPIAKVNGDFPYAGEYVDVAVKGTKTLTAKGDGLEIRTKTRQLCVNQGLAQFLDSYDPAMNTH